MPFEVNNVWSFLAVCVVMLVPTIPAILAFIQARRAAAKADEIHVALEKVKADTEALAKGNVE